MFRLVADLTALPATEAPVPFAALIWKLCRQRADPLWEVSVRSLTEAALLRLMHGPTQDLNGQRNDTQPSLSARTTESRKGVVLTRH